MSQFVQVRLTQFCISIQMVYVSEPH